MGREDYESANGKLKVSVTGDSSSSTFLKCVSTLMGSVHHSSCTVRPKKYFFAHTTKHNGAQKSKKVIIIINTKSRTQSVKC